MHVFSILHNMHALFLLSPKVSNPRLLTSGALLTPSKSQSRQAIISRETTFRSGGSMSPPGVFDRPGNSPLPSNLPDIIESAAPWEHTHTVGEEGCDGGFFSLVPGFGRGEDSMKHFLPAQIFFFFTWKSAHVHHTSSTL